MSPEITADRGGEKKKPTPHNVVEGLEDDEFIPNDIVERCSS